MEIRWSQIGAEGGHQAGRQLLQQMYTDTFGAPMPQVLRTETGKPYFPGDPVYFSICHTKKHAFCVFSESPVGIDAEETDRSIRLELAEKILSAEEKVYFQNAKDPRETLLRFWVLKEAYVKCTGMGLQGYPNHTCFDPMDSRVRELAGCWVAVIREEPGTDKR